MTDVKSRPLAWSVVGLISGSGHYDPGCRPYSRGTAATMQGKTERGSMRYLKVLNPYDDALQLEAPGRLCRRSSRPFSGLRSLR